MDPTKTPTRSAWTAAAAAAALVAAGAFVLFLFRPGQDARRSVAQPTPPTAPVKITIANVGEYSIFNIVASAQGYFRDNGLEATVDEYDSGATSMQALLDGKADFAVAADFVGVTNLFTHPDLRILSKVSDQDVWQVIARTDHGIREPSDLKGKKIGVTRKTSSEFYLGRFLAFNGLGLKDVQIIDLAPPQYVKGIEDGSLDAIVAFEPNGYNVKRELDSDAISWSAQLGQKTTALAYTTAQELAAHPDVVERYMRALSEAQAYVQAHPDQAKTDLARALGYDQAYVTYVWPKIGFSLGLDQDLILAMENEARWLIASGLSGGHAQAPDYLDVIAFDPLAKILPSAVTIVH